MRFFFFRHSNWDSSLHDPMLHLVEPSNQHHAGLSALTTVIPLMLPCRLCSSCRGSRNYACTGLFLEQSRGQNRVRGGGRLEIYAPQDARRMYLSPVNHHKACFAKDAMGVLREHRFVLLLCVVLSTESSRGSWTQHGCCYWMEKLWADLRWRCPYSGLTCCFMSPYLSQFAPQSRITCRLLISRWFPLSFLKSDIGVRKAHETVAGLPWGAWMRSRCRTVVVALMSRRTDGGRRQ